MITQSPTKRVAVVVPLSLKFNPTADEEVSLRHLTHFLGSHDKYMLAPHGLQVDFQEFKVKYFSTRFFGSAKAHSQMMLSQEVYAAFLDYEYILMYHLDALVFSDQLREWCDAGYDLIGSPWIPHKDAPYGIDSRWAGKVGNTGFALLNVRSCLKVLTSNRYAVDLEFYDREALKVEHGLNRVILQGKRWVKRLKRFNNVQWEVAGYEQPADWFWASRAQHYYPDFLIAPLDVALKFSFECVPRHCFELTNHTLPFGCHAWQRYDRKFWEPFLLK